MDWSAELPLLREQCWRLLEQAVAEKGQGWRTPVLATSGPEGPEARTVVLRSVEVERSRLAIYCDSRSPKVAQLRADPRAVLVAWSAAWSCQLRLNVSIDVAESGLDVSSRWAQLSMTPAAQDYLAPLPPGSPLDALLPKRASREHFCVLWADVRAIDWLLLSQEGHRRARFDGQGARWLVP